MNAPDPPPPTESLNPYAAPLAEEVAVQAERTRWRIVAVVIGLVCGAVVGLTIFALASSRINRKMSPADAFTWYSFSVGMAVLCGASTCAVAIVRSFRAWDQYDVVLQRKRELLDEVYQRREAARSPAPNAGPSSASSPFADKAP